MSFWEWKKWKTLRASKLQAKVSFLFSDKFIYVLYIHLPDLQKIFLTKNLISKFFVLAVILWSFCNSSRTFCNRICTFDVGVQGKVPIERWLFTREPKDRSSSLFLFLIIKPKFGLFLSMSLTHTPMLFRLDWCGFGRWGWLLNANLGKFQWWLKFVWGFADEL